MVGVMKAIYAMVDGNVSGAVRGGTEEKVISTLTYEVNSLNILNSVGFQACRKTLSAY